MSDDISKELAKLEALAAGPSSSKKGATATIAQTLDSLDHAMALAEEEIERGADPDEVIKRVTKVIEAKKSDTEKGLKEWYNSLARLGKGIDKRFHHEINEISTTYESPSPLFSSDAGKQAMNQAVVNTMARRGCWASVDSMAKNATVAFSDETSRLHHEMQNISRDLVAGDAESALRWTSKHHAYLSSPPHPSPLPFQLHRARFVALLRKNAMVDGGVPAALKYAQDHLFPFITAQPGEVYRLLGAIAFSSDLHTSPYADLLSPAYAAASLVPLFRIEFCRLHGWPKEDPLDVVVELGANGALNKIEKARKVMQDRLGDVRTWEELPMELPLPAHRRYHSIFACPVSKEQATESNPPKMLACGHVIAHDSLTKLSKHGRRAVKCPYCPQETAIASALRLYF